jgi:hypothetical protein
VTWILVIMWGLVAVLAAIFVGGLMAPATRTVVRAIPVRATRDATWTLLRTVDTTPAWCVSLPRMEVCHDAPQSAIGLDLIDDGGAKTGAWELTLSDVLGEPGTTRITLSETATVKNPVVRFFRSFRSPARRVDAFLVAAAAQLGDEDAAPVDA